jgi:hypothetical protein
MPRGCRAERRGPDGRAVDRSDLGPAAPPGRPVRWPRCPHPSRHASPRRCRAPRCIGPPRPLGRDPGVAAFAAPSAAALRLAGAAGASGRPLRTGVARSAVPSGDGGAGLRGPTDGPHAAAALPDAGDQPGALPAPAATRETRAGGQARGTKLGAAAAGTAMARSGAFAPCVCRLRLGTARAGVRTQGGRMGLSFRYSNYNRLFRECCVLASLPLYRHPASLLKPQGEKQKKLAYCERT